MKIKITDEMENDHEEKIEIRGNISVGEILKKLDIDPFEAIV